MARLERLPRVRALAGLHTEPKPMPALDLDGMVAMFGATGVLAGTTEPGDGADPAVVAMWGFKTEMRALAVERGLCRADGTQMPTDNEGGDDHGRT
ncbi:MAG: hypothetical protein M3Q03_06400 [Chloroflexota bacterium]|nr:hypothetical protein [Chloroflexota bacterium]